MSDPAHSYDYDAFHHAFSGRFLAALGGRMPHLHGQEAALLVAGDELLAARAHLIVDEASRANLRLAALVLGCYRALLPVVERALLLDALRAAFCEPYEEEVVWETRRMLDQAPDPLLAITEASKARESSYFGPSFTFERLQDDPHAYLVNVRSCLWHRFFVSFGVPELTPIFCAFDFNWMRAVDPARDGFRVERPTTLGYGHDACRFWHIRTRREGQEEG